MIDWIMNLPAWVWLTFIVHGVTMGTIAYLILLERKTASWVQDRIGPNRVGLGFGIIPFVKNWKMWGLGQPMADGLKFLVKEDYRPAGVDRILFTIAPMIMIIAVIVSIAVIPWGGTHQAVKVVDVSGAVDPAAVAAAAADAVPLGARMVGQPVIQTAGGDPYATPTTPPTPPTAPPTTTATVTYRYAFQIADLDIGVLFILAILSLAVYGVVVGGWASNNKYSFLGGLRATAQMVSYEIPLGLSVLAIVVMFGTLDLGLIVEKQAHYWAGFIPAWNIFAQPLTFLMFLVCIHAEANRAPFDLAEAEQELVGGYHTEYSSMRFALFFLAEYAGMITTSAVCVALFFGGWHLPWIEWLWAPLAGNVSDAQPGLTTSLLACAIRSMVFFAKTLAIIFVFMWVRWTLPRFRFDQLMLLAWRGMIPISLGLMLVTTVGVYWMAGANPRFVDVGGAVNITMISGPMAAVLLAGNAVTLLGAMLISRMLPAMAPMNRRLRIPGSRFTHTPLPAIGAAASNA